MTHVAIDNTLHVNEDVAMPTDDLIQSITWGINRSGKATLAIKSAHFGTYLRMDGRGNLAPTEGGGIVNCQTFVGIRELFRIIPQSDGSVAIQSVYSGDWLRMDGGNVTDNGGGGKVNCQSFVGFMEKFYIDPVDGGAVAFRSASYGTYLRMDAINAATQSVFTGGGSINCSKDVRSWERFYIEAVRPVVALRALSCNLYLRVDCCNSKEGVRISGQRYLGAWEKFVLVRAEDGTVSLKSEAFNSFLHVQDEQGSLNVSNNIKSKFSINFQTEGQVLFECLDYNQPLYLAMNSLGEVSCESGPISDSKRFLIVVDI